MSKKAHTQGKWEAKGLYVFAGNNCIGICDTDNDTETRMKANAKVMAAAPEVTEALEKLLAAAEMTTFSDQFPQECENARAALSKATGGE